MMRHGSIAAVLVAAGWLAGCSQDMPGTSRSMGEVEFPLAFAAGRDVMSQYFSIETADPQTGVITSRPQAVPAPRERILGASPARHVATLRVRKEGKEVVALATVAVQRQGSAILRQQRPGADSYDTVPNQTPAERDAATTVEQNESWRTMDYAHDLERKMLTDLYRSLNPGPAK